jgi:hypothetical protein
VATFFTSNAEAGFKIRLGFGGPLHAFNTYGNSGGHSHRHHRRRSYVVSRTVKKKVHVAKKSTPVTEKVAEVEKPEVVAAVPVTETVTIADNENSSITTAAVDPSLVTTPETPATTATVEPATGEPPVAQTTEVKREKSASKLDCKKFFPSVGMTLTVPCE